VIYVLDLEEDVRWLLTTPLLASP